MRVFFIVIKVQDTHELSLIFYHESNKTNDPCKDDLLVFNWYHLLMACIYCYAILILKIFHNISC